MIRMAKARKSNAKRSPTTEHHSGLPPLNGLQKAAWWSVPALGAVALVCASTVGVLFFNKPVTIETPAANRSPGELAASSKEIPETTLVSGEPTEKVAIKADETKIVDDKTPTPIPEPKAVIAPEAQTKAFEPVAAAVPVAPVTVNATKTISLTCADGKINFEGKRDLKFVDNQPAMEVTEEGSVKFASLFFNGTDQSAELPTISRAQGSIELVTLMPDRKTAVILDSDFQRLTIRKNRAGLRWRIAATEKQDDIRMIKKPVDFNKWHHIMMTWQDGGDAIIYVDGVEHDRFPYVHAQPHFGEYEKVVLGRTRNFDGRYYESRVNRFVVYDKPIPAEKVSELNQSVRRTYPFIFR